MSTDINSVCVYCGSSLGVQPHYAQAAREFGLLLAARGIKLVYGGGHTGLMGVVADAALEGGGYVIGVIPTALQERELAHQGLQELYVVADMHERKAKMAASADAFVALPGGLGTLEELFEMLTWLQLGLHQKPVGVLNVAQFYDGLLSFVGHSQHEGFVRPQHAALLKVANDGQRLLQLLQE